MKKLLCIVGLFTSISVNAQTSDTVYVKSLPIPPASATKIVTQGEKLILPETAGIRIVSDTDASIAASQETGHGFGMHGQSS